MSQKKFHEWVEKFKRRWMNIVKDDDGCGTSRLPHFLENRIKDGGEFSITLKMPFTLRKIPGTHFC
jgi:hypothetical protein